MSLTKITKAVFPVAGLGTRFLPATKASPKEMLPIVDKPLIQYAVEEAVSAGITDLIFITGRNKRSIEDHFDCNPELEYELEQKNKQKMLDIVKNVIPKHIKCIYIRQPKVLGLGDAVLRAKSVVGNEHFAVLLADELIDSEPGALSQMIDIYAKTCSSVLGVYEIPKSDVRSYGIVKTQNYNGYDKIEKIVEKPKEEQAPSNLAVVGRYILSPKIFSELLCTKQGIGGEIQLTDAISSLMNYETVFAKTISGQRYDCGSKNGYLEATMDFGLKHPETSQIFKKYLERYNKTNSSSKAA